MKINAKSEFAARFSFVMFCLSGIFCFTSGPWIAPIRVANDFPNCVSFGWQTERFSTGVVSNNGVSTLFLTSQDIYNQQGRNSHWSERRDGHFCNFNIPDIGANEPGLFGIWLTTTTVGWYVPYLLMMLLWTVCYAASGGFRLSALDVMLGLAIGILLTLCIEARYTLPWILFLNLATAILFVAFVTFLPFVIFRIVDLPKSFVGATRKLFDLKHPGSLSPNLRSRLSALALLIFATAITCFHRIQFGLDITDQCLTKH